MAEIFLYESRFRDRSRYAMGSISSNPPFWTKHQSVWEERRNLYLSRLYLGQYKLGVFGD